MPPCKRGYVRIAVGVLFQISGPRNRQDDGFCFRDGAAAPFCVAIKVEGLPESDSD